MIRKLATALLLILLTLVLVSFAVANRQIVTVSLDPFDQADPALVVSQPLYLVVFVVLIAGVMVGGCAAWLRQARWRGRARRAEAQLGSLRGSGTLRAGTLRAREQPGAGPSAAGPRLVIPPPAA
jgi:uncharacterized integral membrane protein